MQLLTPRAPDIESARRPAEACLPRIHAGHELERRRGRLMKMAFGPEASAEFVTLTLAAMAVCFCRDCRQNRPAPLPESQRLAKEAGGRTAQRSGTAGDVEAVLPATRKMQKTP